MNEKLKIKYLVAFFLFTILVSFNTVSQINKNGNYFIKNYSIKDYKAAEQNWAIVQDSRGIMYFGNNDNGILEFDGETWRSIPIPNNTIVRSLAIDENGLIYVGAVNDFGYLAPDKKGSLQFVSLATQLSDSIKNKISDIWKIHVYKDYVVFSSFESNIVYKQLKLIKEWDLEVLTFLTFGFNQYLYTAHKNLGLVEYNIEDFSKKIYPLPEIFKQREVFSIVPFDDSNLLFSTFPGEQAFYLFNTFDKSIKPFGGTYINEFAANHLAYNVLKIRENFLITTVMNGGAIEIDRFGNPIASINSKNGLYKETDDVVINSYTHDKEKGQTPLWLALNNGISKVLINSPFRKYSSQDGLLGIVMDAVRFNDILYVATTNGVFWLEQNDFEFHFNKIPQITNQVRMLEVFKYNDKELLIAATAEGLFEIIKYDAFLSQRNNINPRDKDFFFNEDYFYVKQSKYHPKMLMVGKRYGYDILFYENDKWYENLTTPEINGKISSLIEIDKNQMLLSNDLVGFQVLNYDIEKSQFDENLIKLDTTNGLKSLNNNIAFSFVNRIWICTYVGLQIYLPDEMRFVEDYSIDSAFAKKSIHKLSMDKHGNLWFVTIDGQNKYIEKAVVSGDKYQVETIPFKILPNMSIQNIVHDDEIAWICGSDGLYSFDNSFEKDYNQTYPTLIRSVYIGQDSLYFYGAFPESDSLHVLTLQPEHFIPVLSYRNNNIKFFYAAPSFDDEEATEYSFYLENFDPEDQWSNWTKETKKEYTNLYEGSYIFKVKARNVYGIESTVAEFAFEIKPPWQRTIIAYILYVVFAVLFIYFIVKFNARRLIKEKERLERIVEERTREIRKQKDEIEGQRDEIKSQRDEIEAQRDNLEELNKEIEKKNENITASIRYAQRIQKAIMPSDDFIRSLLPQSFVLFKPKDIVSGDFYFCGTIEDKIIFTAVDCTGHGVPGAFVSIVGSNWLTRALNEEKLVHPADILNYLSRGVNATLRREEDLKVKDGMDISLVCLDLKNMKGEWAGAYNPMYLYRKGLEEPLQFKPDVYPIGNEFTDKFTTYTNNEFDIQAGDAIYVFSDGYIDQFGGPDRKKFMKKNFRELIERIQDKSMEEQRNILDDAIEDWKKSGNSEQIDDILVFGVRI